MTQPLNTHSLLEPDALLLNAYVDDELDPSARQALEQRLTAEPDMRAALGQLTALRTAIAANVHKSTLSGDFRDRIAAIGAQPTPEVRRGRSARSGVDWRMIAAVAVISFGAGSWATHLVATRGLGRAASQALVAVHRHALLAADPIEVASSDRHTVKPWFDAKLALSPPVADLAGDGFPLAGGRIDVIDGRRVPVLIYRHGRHLISVIAVPDAGARDDGAVADRSTRDGYVVLGWRGTDFRFSAVSDVVEDALTDFVDKLRRAMQTTR